jgi:hypothetical protein
VFGTPGDVIPLARVRVGREERREKAEGAMLFRDIRD